ncbi:hypothetical protein EDD15DRAFT_2270857 [Pisolithus albus]|nr:hypothetical protein EDD15DRAFT_2270857 [Pisolithus albus]
MTTFWKELSARPKVSFLACGRNTITLWKNLSRRRQRLRSWKSAIRIIRAEHERLINVQRNSTHAEDFQLKGEYILWVLPADQSIGELEMLQSLHVVHITKVRAERFEFVYGSSYVVSTRCVEVAL